MFRFSWTTLRVVLIITKFGGRSNQLNMLAREIWMWCIGKKIHLSVAHVPGVENTEADEESRTINDDTEWPCHQMFFKLLEKLFHSCRLTYLLHVQITK